MSKHLVFSCAHAHFQHDNERATWLGMLISEERPDVVINLGDSADMPSLSSFDKGTRAAMGKTYEKDIAAFIDFHERLSAPIAKQKKKRPRWIFCEGNHEHRIHRAVNSAPELEGAISLDDLELDAYYDDVVLYDGNTPGVISVDGVFYAHFF